MFSQTETFFADIPTLERAKEISDETMKENNISEPGRTLFLSFL